MWSKWIAITGAFVLAGCSMPYAKTAVITTVGPSQYAMEATTPGPSWQDHVDWLDHNASLVCDRNYELAYEEQRIVMCDWGPCDNLELDWRDGQQASSRSTFHCLSPA